MPGADHSPPGIILFQRSSSLLFPSPRIKYNMVEWLTHRPMVLVYAFLFLNTALESPVPPYPADIFVLLFAFLSGQGSYSPYLVYALSAAGSVAGIMVLYYLALEKGDAILGIITRSFLRHILSPSLIERIKRKFHAHGDLFILFHRFLPGMRAPICFTAGLSRKPAGKVFIYSLASVLSWDLILVLVGFRLGRSWDTASRFLRRYNLLALIAAAVILTVMTLVYFLRAKKPRD
jgi:membrane protein DedA with SNARE-associated domain